MKNEKLKIENVLKIFLLVSVLCVGVFAQNTPPEPSAPKSVKIPAVNEFTLKNGLKVAVVERHDIPLVSVRLLINNGAVTEGEEKAGLADMTASLLTKGTKTRSAVQIAEEMEFLGANLNSGAGWISSTVTLNVMSDKLEKALTIMADAVINPSFSQAEIDLLKSQTLDGLTYNLTQPGFLANYVASVYSYKKHPVGGTISSITGISRDDIVDYESQKFIPNKSVLIFTGDINEDQAKTLAEKYFGKWTNPKLTKLNAKGVAPFTVKEKKKSEAKKNLVKRILVVDLPNSGQAAVSFTKNIKDNGRIYRKVDEIGAFEGKTYYPAIVLNSLLGGGYSSRLNQEIRIKRGLSYGAGSGFNWEWLSTDFGTRTQTKNESAAEVAELVTIELKKLSEGKIPETELNPRRLVLTGGFGQSLETNQGLANAISDLYAFDLPTENLNSYMNNVMSVTDKQINQFAAENFNGGDIIIVGDYAKFKDDLKKRFPNKPIDVISFDELDLNSDNLRKDQKRTAKPKAKSPMKADGKSDADKN